MCIEEKQFSSALLILVEPSFSIIKPNYQEKQKFNNIYTLAYMGDKENWSHFLQWPSHHLKYRLPVKNIWKTLGERGGQLWQVIMESTVNKHMILCIFTSDLFTDKSSLRCNYPISGAKRDIPLQTETSLLNVNVTHKRATRTPLVFYCQGSAC